MATPATANDAANNKAGKTLSKASLYAPLVAYSHEDPAFFVRTKKPTTATQDGTLFDFFGRVSVDYHRNGSFQTSKNSSNRPSNVQEFKEKLQQRALTLVKGGINKSTAPASSRDRTLQHVSRKRKRRNTASGKRKDEVKGLNALPLEEQKRQHDFLEQLNRLWIEHTRRLVIRNDDDVATLDFNAISQRLQSVAPGMEWIGARICIYECHAHPKWVQRQGILVSSTSHTWKVMESIARDDGTLRFDVFLVPKKGSVLTVAFSLDSMKDLEEEESADGRRARHFIQIQLRDDPSSSR